MKTDLDILKDRQALVGLLTEAGARFTKANECTCPFHEDRSPSSGIFEKDGHWYFKCQSTSCGVKGDFVQIYAKINSMGNADAFRHFAKEQNGDQVKRPLPWNSAEDIERWLRSKYQEVIRYDYRTSFDRLPEYTVFRCEPGAKGKKKDIYQTHMSRGMWWLKKPAGKTPLYNIPAVLAKPEAKVIVVEGEKCVEALKSIGLPRAVTSAGGAGKADLTDWETLRNRHVVIWPDNDEPGNEHGETIADLLMPIAASVTMVDPSMCGLEEGQDVADLIEYLRSNQATDAQCRDTVVEMLKGANEVGAAQGLENMIEEMIQGLRLPIPTPWPFLDKCTRALQPGTLTVLCGNPGDGKSYLALQLVWHAILEADIKAAAYFLEDEHEDHMLRLLAQLSESSWMGQYHPKNDPDKTKAQLMRCAMAEFKQSINRVGRKIHCCSDREVTLMGIAQWVDEMAKQGNRLIVVDPITAASTGRERFSDDLKFVMSCRTSARKYRCSVLFVTHPKQGFKRAGMEALAGGAAYSRFVHTVLWLQYGRQRSYAIRAQAPPDLYGNEKPEQTTCKTDRVMKICKARRGPGQGINIAFQMNRQSLRFEELGIVEKAEKEDT